MMQVAELTRNKVDRLNSGGSGAIAYVEGNQPKASRSVSQDFSNKPVE